MDFNTSSGIKRLANCDMDQSSCSKLPQIASTSISIGAAIHADGNARVTIHNINVGHPQQPTPEQAPYGIEFQVADPVDTFRGREQTFHEVQHAFQQQKDKQCNLVAVCGYGGMGKTQVARMYIKRIREELHNVVWIFAESENTMMESFKQLRNKLTDKGYRCYSDQDIYEYLNSEFTIFIFDNAENIRSVQDFLPVKQNNSLFLVTSKSKNWDAFHTIELRLLDLTEAEDIMKAVLVDKHNIEIGEKQLEELVRKLELETIPLLLQIRAGYICRQVLNLKKRGRRYDIGLIVKELNNQYDLIIKKFHNFILDPYKKSVFSAICQTLEQIWNEDDEASKTATKMLGISAYLNPDNIEEEILKRLLKIENENILNDSLDILDQYSIFQISKNIIGIHRTVQQCVQYYHREVIKSNEFYRLTLPALIYDDDDYKYRTHCATIFKHGEKDIESLCTFYERNKCYIFHENLATFVPSKILQLLLNKTDLIRNPNFLYHAVESYRNDIIQMLRNCGGDFNVKDDGGFTALFYACVTLGTNVDKDFHKNKWGIIKSLIENGAEVNSQNFEGNMVIHSLCNFGKNSTEKDNEICQFCALMIQVGANLGIKNNAGQTAADLAREHGLSQTFQLLNAPISGYRYILHIAARINNFILLKWLIKYEVCHENEVDDTGCTVLHVLAGLTQLETKDEQILLYETASLLGDKWNVSIVNNAGDTPADVALRCGREMMADLFNAFVQPGHIIYKTAAHRSKLEHFSFMRSEDSEHVNEQDDTGCTFLHALGDLETHGDPDLELDIVKLADHLVVTYYADVNMRNKENDTAADVARRRGHHLLADLLINPEYFLKENLIRVALKHKLFNLVKYAWWRYVNTTPMYIEASDSFHFHLSLRIVNIIYTFNGDTTVTDSELINLIEYLNYKEIPGYGSTEYDTIFEIVRQYGRVELADWLQAGQ